LDEERARTVAGAVAAARASDAVTLTGVAVAVRNDRQPPQVEVETAGTVRLVFTPAMPGQSRERRVGATSVAVPQQLGPQVAAPDC
jgi:hypothetical protein